MKDARKPPASLCSWKHKKNSRYICSVTWALHWDLYCTGRVLDALESMNMAIVPPSPKWAEDGKRHQRKNDRHWLATQRKDGSRNVRFIWRDWRQEDPPPPLALPLVYSRFSAGSERRWMRVHLFMTPHGVCTLTQWSFWADVCFVLFMSYFSL